METDYRPVILVTNDDGINAPGIRALVEAVIDLGHVFVVAPDSPQSGMGHAVTIGSPLRLDEVNEFKDLGIRAWQCSGTPVDCVKLARDKVLHRKPDLCVSGINHGSNASINVIYSGTMSAAMEAALENIPSVGFSLLDQNLDADFTIARAVARMIAGKMLRQQLPEHMLLNVNIPVLDEANFKGVKVCRQANARWAENFEHRIDPRGRDYYWLTGQFVYMDEGNDTDIQALQDGFASIVPIKINFTDQRVKSWLDDESFFD